MISLIESPLKVYSLLRCFVFAAGMRFCPDGLRAVLAKAVDVPAKRAVSNVIFYAEKHPRIILDDLTEDHLERRHLDMVGDHQPKVRT
jgi:hypothetical protein